MRTRFVLALDDNVTPEINKAIGELIKAQGAGWWHWYQHTWLITDPQGRSADWWRDKFRTLEPPPGFLIFNVDNGAWSGLTKKNYYEWMNSTWNPKQ